MGFLGQSATNKDTWRVSDCEELVGGLLTGDDVVILFQPFLYHHFVYFTKIGGDTLTI